MPAKTIHPRISGWRKNGDCSLLLDFAAEPLSGQLEYIHSFARQLRKMPLPGQIEVVPAKTSLMLVFAKPIVDWESTFEQLEQLGKHISTSQIHSRLHTLPVCYHPELATDLASVLAATGFSLEALIKLHSSREYTLSMLGFLPGFMYLENLDQQLVLPRKSTPAISVPAGSIAIAGDQCGLYSLASPGGWHVIGRTPEPLLDWHAENPIQIQPMDKIRFQPIGLAEFKQLIKTASA